MKFKSICRVIIASVLSALYANAQILIPQDQVENLVSGLAAKAGLSATNTFTGVNTFPSFNLTPANVTIVEGSPDTGVIDVTKGGLQAIVDEATTFTFSTGTHVAGRRFGFTKLTNSTASPVVITIPTSSSLSFGGPRSTFTIPAASTVAPQWYDDGTTYFLLGEPVLLSDLTTVSASSLIDGLYLVEQGGVPKKANSTETVAGAIADQSNLGIYAVRGYNGLQWLDSSLANFNEYYGGGLAYSSSGGSGYSAWIFYGADAPNSTGSVFLRIYDTFSSPIITGANSADHRLNTQLDATSSSVYQTPMAAFLPVGVIDFEYVLHVNASSVGGHKYRLVGADGLAISSIIYTVKSIDLTTNAFVIADRVTALNSPVGQAGATVIETVIRGTVVVTAGGTFNMEFAQNATNGTSSILVGSSARWRFLENQ